MSTRGSLATPVPVHHLPSPPSKTAIALRVSSMPCSTATVAAVSGPRFTRTRSRPH